MENTGGKKIIAVINGPNLNMLGKREPEVYGKDTLEKIQQELNDLAEKLGVGVDFFQSNHEGQIVDTIQACMGTCRGLIINPAALTHTSIAIRDALLLLSIPIIEIHLSNIDKRESFRHKSMIADIVSGRISGFGGQGYLLALQAMSTLIAE